jgi:hypothetical protein
MKQIKLIWDFRGSNAEPTAAHHVQHLGEFALTEGLENTICETEEVTETHYMAIMIVGEEHKDDLKERLKPNRGQRYFPE